MSYVIESENITYLQKESNKFLQVGKGYVTTEFCVLDEQW